MEAVALEAEEPLEAGRTMKDIELLQEEDFSTQMNEIVIPFIEKRKTTHTVESIQGGNIHVETLLPDGNFHSVLVIFHGFSEFCAKYDEFSYYALQQGFAICRFDHHGHGFSPRENSVKNEYSKVHIEKFTTYVTDAHSVVSKIAMPLAKEKPLFLFAHSMGGAIAGVYLTKHPQIFKVAILNSPMMEVNLIGLPLWLGRPCANILRLVKGNTELTPAHRNFPLDLVLDTKKYASTSVFRHNFTYKKRFSDDRLKTWGGTMRWLCECLKAIQFLQRKRNTKKIETPILLLQAENDATVLPTGQNIFAKNTPLCELLVVKNADHEEFNGKNTIALPWYTQIFSFYEKHLPSI